MKKYLIIDGNNILHASNSIGKMNVGTTEVQAIFGFLRVMRKLSATYSTMKPIVLFDGASWRHMIYPEYKGNRKKADTVASLKVKEAGDTARAQIPLVKKGLSLLGVTQIRASNMEADDLAAILVDKFEPRGDKIMLVSGDKDWLQLVSPNVSWFDPINDRKVFNIKDLNEKIGINVSDFDKFLEFKALVGDQGDNIPGVGGIGEKGAVEFLERYGSYADFSNQCLDGTVDPTKLDKKFRDLAEDENKRINFSFNLRLMDLRIKSRPDPVNMQVDTGAPDLAKFKYFCDKLLFRSFTKDLNNWVSVFPAHANAMEQEIAGDYNK